MYNMTDLKMSTTINFKVAQESGLLKVEIALHEWPFSQKKLF